MKVILLENQIDIILKSLENYCKCSTDQQLIYATYESLLAQKVDNKEKIDVSKNVINL